jgi:ABC-type branched-subunit amino acid transport system substrate-binding protein
MRCKLRWWIAVAAGLALALSACGGSERRRPLRIGVVVDCQGAYRSLQDVELSGAQLPLIVSGAKRKGREASDGVESTTVAGTPVELVQACSESGEFSTLTQAVRLLVEREHADVVVVGGPYTVDGIALRTVARRYPWVAFIAAANGPREVTLEGAPASVYRVAADYEQGAAGLASYAYRRLGWRRAAIVVDAWVAGWGEETAFVREFCALGGRIARRIPIGYGWPDVAVPRDADGVAVLAGTFSLEPKRLRRLAQGQGDAPRRMLLGSEVVVATDVLRAAGRTIDGVVGATYTPPAAASPEVRAYVLQFARANPGAPAAQAQDPLVVNYRNAVEAVLTAFKRAGGDKRRLRGELDRFGARLLGVSVHMDAHRQATVDTTLVRVGQAGRRSGPSLTKVQTVPGVDQSIGGLVPATYEPTHLGQACKRATPPPWAK